MTGAWAAQDGLVAGAEALVLGVLVFVMGTLVIVNAWSVVDAGMAAETAARQAARAVVEAAPVGDEVVVGDRYLAIATQAAESALRGARRLAPDGPGAPLLTAPPLVEGGLQRGACVRVTVRFEVPVVALPLLGGTGGTRTVTGTHVARVDPFRTGLDGVAGEVVTCS